MNISAVYAPENSSMDFGLVDPESYLIRRDSVSRILAIARELHISLDAIAYAGTSRPNSVSADVLEFFSGKDDAESKDYFYLPYVGKETPHFKFTLC